MRDDVGVSDDEVLADAVDGGSVAASTPVVGEALLVHVGVGLEVLWEALGAELAGVVHAGTLGVELGAAGAVDHVGEDLLPELRLVQPGQLG